ncbi:SDR family oxidoreductase [Streptomyces sp. NPDC001380]|uniref:SDR family oxidoreductase n=1 Tax=Streptomyces sp. NPDC001380 TaxID=3364566 RepID=UPI0036CF9D23
MTRAASARRPDAPGLPGASTATAPAGDSLETLAAGWYRDLETNLLTAVLLTTALEGRLRCPGGRLIVISSSAAQRGGSGPHSAGSYAAAKASLHGWDH